MVAGLPGQIGPRAATVVAVDGRSVPAPVPIRCHSMVALFAMDNLSRSLPALPCAQVGSTGEDIAFQIIGSEPSVILLKEARC